MFIWLSKLLLFNWRYSQALSYNVIIVKIINNQSNVEHLKRVSVILNAYLVLVERAAYINEHPHQYPPQIEDYG